MPKAWKSHLFQASLLAFGLLLLGVALRCGAGHPDSGLVPPPSFAVYSQTYIQGVVGSPIEPAGPMAPEPPAAYSVQPQLPPGLRLEPASGVIHGTPTAPSPEAFYRVTASNASGTANFGLQIVVHAQGAPYAVYYPVWALRGAVGYPLAADTPRFSGASEVEFSVTPELPSGVHLDAATGTLSGTPLAPAEARHYRVTAANAFGTATADISVEVILPRPPEFVYAMGSFAAVVGGTIVPDSPSQESLPPARSFSVSPALPAGLALDPSTGRLAGTPTELSPLTEYVVTATNELGTGSAPVTLSVNPPGWPAIQGFSAAPASVTYGGFILLSWNVANADMVWLNGQPAMDGPVSLNPPLGSTVYLLKAANAKGSAEARVSVTALPKP